MSRSITFGTHLSTQPVSSSSLWQLAICQAYSTKRLSDFSSGLLKRRRVAHPGLGRVSAGMGRDNAHTCRKKKENTIKGSKFEEDQIYSLLKVTHDNRYLSNDREAVRESEGCNGCDLGHQKDWHPPLSHCGRPVSFAITCQYHPWLEK